MPKPWRTYPSFFFVMSLLALAVAFTGFAKTFFIPLAQKSFTAPLIIHIHGVFAFGWLFLFLIQNFLIHTRNYRTHQMLGFFGLFIAGGVLVTMVSAGAVEVSRNLREGAGESAYSTGLGVATSGLLFFLLVLAGIAQRKKPEAHKRWLLLSVIVVLWPAWFRFRHYFPGIPRPDIWFGVVMADSLILVAWIRDYIKTGRIHPVLKYAGLFIILEQCTEILLFDSPNWRSLAKSLYHFLQ